MEYHWNMTKYRIISFHLTWWQLYYILDVKKCNRVLKIERPSTHRILCLVVGYGMHQHFLSRSRFTPSCLWGTLSCGVLPMFLHRQGFSSNVTMCLHFVVKCCMFLLILNIKYIKSKTNSNQSSEKVTVTRVWQQRTTMDIDGNPYAKYTLFQKISLLYLLNLGCLTFQHWEFPTMHRWHVRKLWNTIRRKFIEELLEQLRRRSNKGNANVMKVLRQSCIWSFCRLYHILFKFIFWCLISFM